MFMKIKLTFSAVTHWCELDKDIFDNKTTG